MESLVLTPTFLLVVLTANYMVMEAFAVQYIDEPCHYGGFKSCIFDKGRFPIFLKHILQIRKVKTVRVYTFGHTQFN